MSASIANFATCLGKYDATLSGSAVMDVSGTIGNSDLSMNTGYLMNTNTFTTPPVGNNTGFTTTGWFNPNGAEGSNYTPIFDLSGTIGSLISVGVTPMSIVPSATCILWLDGSNGDSSNFTYSSSNIISTWKDKSGLNNNFTQATTAYQPSWTTNNLNSRGVVNMTGTTNITSSSAITLSSTFTAFIVAYTLTTNSSATLFQADPVPLLWRVVNGGGFQISLNANWGSVISGGSGLSWGIYEVTINGSGAGTVSAYINGTLLGTGTGSALTSSVLNLGSSSTSAYWNGYIAEIVFFSNVLSTTDRQNIEGYLATKWGLRSSLPSGHPNYTTGIPYPLTTSVGTIVPATTTICVSGNSLTPVLVGNYNGYQVYQPTGISANTWNFFAYTVCCSGGTQLVQNLYVNNNTVSVTGGTYAPLTVTNSILGYGAGIFAQYFNGKIDDFRYYGRCITPMEVRVLNSYSYGKSTVSTLVPSVSGISMSIASSTSNLFTIPNTGTYSYIQLKRMGSDGSAYSVNISPASLTPSGNNYLYTDTVTASVGYVYAVTPYILGTPGATTTLSPPPANR